jgi:hypothetical protein
MVAGFFVAGAYMDKKISGHHWLRSEKPKLFR